MLEIASLIVVNLVIAGIIGIIIGYIIGKNSFPSIKPIGNETKPEDKNEKVKHAINPIFKKNSALDSKPLILSSPIKYFENSITLAHLLKIYFL